MKYVINKGALLEETINPVRLGLGVGTGYIGANLVGAMSAAAAGAGYHYNSMPEVTDQINNAESSEQQEQIGNQHVIDTLRVGQAGGIIGGLAGAVGGYKLAGKAYDKYAKPQGRR